MSRPVAAARKRPVVPKKHVVPKKSAAKKQPAATKRAAKAPRSGEALVRHARAIQRRLEVAYPDAHCELDFTTPLQLLVATILSAQCTDKRVNMVTPALFARYANARALAGAAQEEIQELVKSTGFFRNKAKNILGMARALVEEHGGEVPRSMEALVRLPGVGRKTANVILGNAFGVNEGIVVDTHVGRLANRFGLTRETDAVKVEQALIPLFERDAWTMLSHLMIWHGRRVCDARKPRCGECTVRDICPSANA